MKTFDLELKIKNLAKQKEMSIRKLCQKIGISNNGLVASFQNNSLKIETLYKISDVLEVPMAYFFDDDLPPLPDDLPTGEGQENTKPLPTSKRVGKIDDATLRLIERLEKELNDAKQREEWLKRQNDMLMSK